MIEKKLSIRKLYKGKFPTKDSVRLTAEAVAELQREVIRGQLHLSGVSSNKRDIFHTRFRSIFSL